MASQGPSTVMTTEDTSRILQELSKLRPATLRCAVLVIREEAARPESEPSDG